MVCWEDKQYSKLLARIIKKKRDKTQTNKIRNEKGEVTIENTEIQRIVRGYYEQLYTNKINNLEEKDKLLEKYNLPKLNQEETENMNSSITSTEIENFNQKFLLQTKARARRLHRWILPKFRELTPILLKLFQKTAAERKLPNSFYEATNHSNTKTRQRCHKKKKITGQFHWWIDTRILNKILPNRIQQHIKKIIHAST